MRITTETGRKEDAMCREYIVVLALLFGTCPLIAATIGGSVNAVTCTNWMLDSVTVGGTVYNSGSFVAMKPTRLPDSLARFMVAVGQTPPATNQGVRDVASDGDLTTGYQLLKTPGAVSPAGTTFDFHLDSLIITQGGPDVVFLTEHSTSAYIYWALDADGNPIASTEVTGDFDGSVGKTSMIRDFYTVNSQPGGPSGTPVYGVFTGGVGPLQMAGLFLNFDPGLTIYGVRMVLPGNCNACVMSEVFAISEPAPSTAMITQPLTRAVFQRNRRNFAEVPVTGTYIAEATRVEARAVVMGGYAGTSTDWTLIDDTPADGNFSGRLTLAGGGWYAIEIRTYNGETVQEEARVEKIGIGEVFITAGQSNSVNSGYPPLTPSSDIVSALTEDWRTWRHAYDPQPIALPASTPSNGGSAWSRLGDMLVTRLGVPIGFISVGVGATSVAQWLPVGGTCYPRLHSAITALRPYGIRAIIWHQGESDGGAGTPSETYAERLNTVIAQTRIDAGWNIPWGVALASHHRDTTPEEQTLVRVGQQMVIDGDPLVFQGADTDGFAASGYLLGDNTHFNEAGLYEHARLWKRAILKYLFTCDFEPDLNTDLSDLAVLASQWLQANCMDYTICDEEDLDGDRFVDVNDFVLCMENWLR